MAIQVRDPNSASLGGYMDVRGVDLGDGTAAVLTLAATRTASTVTSSTTSKTLIAADLTRIALSVKNNETTKNIYLGYGVAAVVGTNPVLPGQLFELPANVVVDQINVIWAATGSISASVLATTAA